MFGFGGKSSFFVRFGILFGFDKELPYMVYQSYSILEYFSDQDY